MTPFLRYYVSVSLSMFLEISLRDENSKHMSVFEVFFLNLKFYSVQKNFGKCLYTIEPMENFIQFSPTILRSQIIKVSNRFFCKRNWRTETFSANSIYSRLFLYSILKYSHKMAQTSVGKTRNSNF